MTIPALRLAEQLVLEAGPGDTMYFTWISDRSYAPDQIIAVLSLEEEVELPQVRGAYDGPGRRARSRALQQFQKRMASEKLRVVRILREQQCVGPTRSTDIAGFFQAAVELFTAAQHEKQKRLIVFSDLVDNRRFTVSPDLNDIEVTIYLLKMGPDPTDNLQRQDGWQQKLQQWGTRQVTFIRPLVQPEWLQDNRECQ